MARSTRSNVSESPAAPSPAEGPPQSSRGAFSSGGKRAAAGAAAAQDTPSKRQRVKAKAVSKVPATPPTGAKRTKTSPRLASVVKKLVLAGDDLRDVPRTVSASNFYGTVCTQPIRCLTCTHSLPHPQSLLTSLLASVSGGVASTVF